MNDNRQLIYTLITVRSEVKRNQKKASKTKAERLRTLCMVGMEKVLL